MAEKYGLTPFEYGFDIRLPRGVELDASIFCFDFVCFKAHMERLNKEADDARRAQGG